MYILPVIDLKQGVVVRGLGGHRDKYRPIESPLCPSSEPGKVAQAFADLGFEQAYIADLDAIQQGQRQLWLEPSPACTFAGLNLMVDAGLSDLATAQAMAATLIDGKPLSGLVAGLESLPSPQALSEMVQAVGPQRLVFSLDLKAGRPLTVSAAWQGLSPEKIATIALRAGVRRMIVLDLAKVGMDGGVGTEPLCRTLRCLAPELEIIAGGGVRSREDLVSLARAGCDAALVASALHDGRLTIDDCVAIR